eukprot:gene31591-6785_t
MNRRLLDPFQSVALPELIEEYFEHGVTTCVCFNRRGTLLASGNTAGEVVIWDFDTRGVAKIIKGHDAAVTSLSWSHNGKVIVSGGKDNKVILWDVLQGVQVSAVSLPSDVSSVSLSPHAPYKCVVSLADSAPVLVNFSDNSMQNIPLTDNDAALPGGSKSVKAQQSGDGSQSAVAIFSHAAEVIYVGQPRGTIAVLDASSMRFLDVIKTPNSRILSLSLNRKGTLLLANCQDRVIRMYELTPISGNKAPSYDETELKAALADAKAAGGKVQKSGSLLYGADSDKRRPLVVAVREFQNAVERPAWRMACFSSDSEHVIGAAATKSTHHIYVWNRLYGNMERVLEGPMDGIVAMVWHHLRSVLLSVSSTGRIYCWARAYAENWSAFAPDFKELEENREYVEREDEFDWDTAEATAANQSVKNSKENEALGEDDEDVDILTLEVEKVFSSDNDDDEPDHQLHYLPVQIEPDVEDVDVFAAGNGKSPACGTDMGMEEQEEEEEDQEMAEKSADKGLSGGELRRKRRVNWQELEKDGDSDFE